MHSQRKIKQHTPQKPLKNNHTLNNKPIHKSLKKQQTPQSNQPTHDSTNKQCRFS